MATRPDVTGKAESPALDAAGAALSSLCLIHCLAVPLFALAMPAVVGASGHDHAHDHLLHLLLIGLAAPVSVFAFWRGLRRHGRVGPLTLGVAGFALMLAGAFAHGPMVQLMTVAGGLVVAGAHLANWRARRLG
ncbi:MAG: MerC domain-containing protein [Thermaurantiacus sp.]